MEEILRRKSWDTLPANWSRDFFHQQYNRNLRVHHAVKQLSNEKITSLFRVYGVRNPTQLYISHYKDP